MGACPCVGKERDRPQQTSHYNEAVHNTLACRVPHQELLEAWLLWGASWVGSLVPPYLVPQHGVAETM